jgi:hypothetical protein
MRGVGELRVGVRETLEYGEAHTHDQKREGITH